MMLVLAKVSPKNIFKIAKTLPLCHLCLAQIKKFCIIERVALNSGTNSKKEDYDQSTTQQQPKRLHYSNRTETKRKRTITTFATHSLGLCPTRKTGRNFLRKTSFFPCRIYKKGVIRDATKIQQIIQSGQNPRSRHSP